jgi:chromosomal replication initiation ATPase DnaA
MVTPKPSLSEALKISDIIQATSNVTQIPIQDILDIENRSENGALPRHMVCFFAHYQYKISLRSIQNYFGFAQHVSVINEINRMRGYLEAMESVKIQIRTIQAQLDDNAVATS